jgi:membrane protease subunit (stomatin/prohibitin family)
MGFFDKLANRVSNEISYGISREVSYATRRSVQGTMRDISNKINNIGKWRCPCGAENSGKFCTKCGNLKGEGMQCVNCGWKAKDSIPRFCPECGSDFDGDPNT